MKKNKIILVSLLKYVKISIILLCFILLSFNVYKMYIDDNDTKKDIKTQQETSNDYINNDLEDNNTDNFSKKDDLDELEKILMEQNTQ